MTKKKETRKVEIEESQTQEEIAVKTAPVVEQPKPIERKRVKDEWEIKDRIYYLKSDKKPISFLMNSSNLYWFDEEKGYERELKYCENQQTCFVDEMKGDQRLAHIIFRNGNLFVPKQKTILQKLLSLYHPSRNVLFYEHKPSMVAGKEVEILELEADAILAARDMDIDMAEAIMRAEIGSKVSELSSKELKRDLLVFAKRNPKLFLELADDENVMLRNFGIKAVEEGILKLSHDQRYFSWASNGRKLLTIPFDEHPYSALAVWFKTDEGMEIYSNIEKRLK